MSKEVDALVLIGHAYKMSLETPSFLDESIGQGLWYVRNGKTEWHNGQPITEQDKNNLYAAEVFLNLGGLVVSRFTGTHEANDQPKNPYRDMAVGVIDEISPLQPEDLRGSQLVIKPLKRFEVDETSLGEVLVSRLKKEPEKAEEFRRKWVIAQEIERRRGKVVLMAYDTKELLEGVGELEMDKIAPDTVEFDDEANIVSQSHNVKNLVDRAGVQARPTEFPYYSTFRQESATEMLADALVDLRQLKQELGSV